MSRLFVKVCRAPFHSQNFSNCMPYECVLLTGNTQSGPSMQMHVDRNSLAKSGEAHHCVRVSVRSLTLTKFHSKTRSILRFVVVRHSLQSLRPTLITPTAQRRRRRQRPARQQVCRNVSANVERPLRQLPEDRHFFRARGVRDIALFSSIALRNKQTANTNFTRNCMRRVSFMLKCLANHWSYCLAKFFEQILQSLCSNCWSFMSSLMLQIC